MHSIPTKRGLQAGVEAEGKKSKRAKKTSALPTEAHHDTFASKALPAEVLQDIKAFCDQIAEDEFHVAGPPAIREMLVKGIPHALETPSGERHPAQEEVIKMMREVLETEEQRLQGCLATAQEAMDGLSAEKSNLEAAVERAEAALQEKSQDVQDKENSFTTAEEVLKNSKTNLEAATQNWKDAEAAERQCVSEKEFLVETLRASFDPLIAGTVENAKEQQQHLSKVIALFQQLGADVSLVGGLRSALGKKSEDRGDFDNIVVHELGEVHKKYVASLDERITNAATATAGKLSTVGAIEAELQVAEHNKQQCEDVLRVAQEEKQSLETDLTVNKKTVKDYAKTTVKPVETALKMAHMNSKFFVETTKSLFTSLVERTTPQAEEQVQKEKDVPETEAL